MQQVLDTNPTTIKQQPQAYQQQQQQQWQVQQEPKQENKQEQDQQQTQQQQQQAQQPSQGRPQQPPPQVPQQQQGKPPRPPPLPMLQTAADFTGAHLLQQQQQQQLLLQQMSQMSQAQAMQQAQQLLAARTQLPPKSQPPQPRAKAAPQARADTSKRGKGRKQQQKQAQQTEVYYPQYLAERHFPSSKDPLKITVQVELDGKKQDETYPATLTIKHCFDNYFSYFLDLPKELRARIRKAEIKGWDQVDELTIRICLSSFKPADATPAASSLGGGQVSPSGLAATTSAAAAQTAALSWPATSAPANARSSRSALPPKPTPPTGSPTSAAAARSSPPADPFNPTALDPAAKSPFALSPHLQAAAAAALNPNPDALSSLLLAQQFSSDPSTAAQLDLILKNPHLAANPAAAAAAAAANLKATMAAAAAAGFSLGPPFQSPSSYAPTDLNPSTAAAAAAAALNPLLFPQLLQASGSQAPAAAPDAANNPGRLPRLPTAPDTGPPYDEQHSKRIRFSEGLPHLDSAAVAADAASQPASLLNPTASTPPGALSPNTLAMRSLTGGPPLHLQQPPLPDDDTLDGASWDRYMTAMLDAPPDKLWPHPDPSIDPTLIHGLPMADFLQSDPSCAPLASPRLPDIPPLHTGIPLGFPGPVPSPNTRQLDLAAAAQAKDLTAALNASSSPLLASALHKTAQGSSQPGQHSPGGIAPSGGPGQGQGLCDASTMVAELLHMVGYLKPSFKDRLLLMVALQKAGMGQLAAVHLAMKGAWDKKSIQKAHEIFGQIMEANQVQQLRMDGVGITAGQVASLSFPVLMPGLQGASSLREGLLEVLTFCQASAQLQAEVLLAVQHADDLRRQVINTGLVDACVRRNLDDLKGIIYSIVNV